MEKKSTHLTPGEFFVNQEAARTAEMEAQISVAHNWERAIREKPERITASPLVALAWRKKRKKHTEEDSEEDAKVKKMLVSWANLGRNRR